MSAAFYRICQDGHVYSADEKVPVRTLYFVETCLIPEKTTRTGYQYYTSYIQNNERERVTDNVIQWRGVSCKLEKRDIWTSDKTIREFGFKGTGLVAHITDSKANEMRIFFDNTIKDGQAWKQLMEYVRDLDGSGSHRAVKAARLMR